MVQRRRRNGRVQPERAQPRRSKAPSTASAPSPIHSDVYVFSVDGTDLGLGPVEVEIAATARDDAGVGEASGGAQPMVEEGGGVEPRDDAIEAGIRDTMLFAPQVEELGSLPSEVLLARDGFVFLGAPAPAPAPLGPGPQRERTRTP